MTIHPVTALRDFMKFHAAKELVIERSEPAAFRKKLLKAVWLWKIVLL
jgi:hypothetical protein